MFKMQPKSVNRKRLMMSLVGSKASRASKIVSLFYLILKIFTRQLLRNSCRNASALMRQIEITEDDQRIIYHSRKSLLFDKGNFWIKKGRDLFDVTMRAYDGAEVCELVGIFLLEKSMKFVI